MLLVGGHLRQSQWPHDHVMWLCNSSKCFQFALHNSSWHSKLGPPNNMVISSITPQWIRFIQIPNEVCDNVVSHRVKRTPTTFRLPNSKNNSPFANRAGRSLNSYEHLQPSQENPTPQTIHQSIQKIQCSDRQIGHHLQWLFLLSTNFELHYFTFPNPISTHHSLRPIHLHHQSTCLKQPQTTQSRPNNSNLLNHTMLNTNLHNYNRV